MLAKCEPAKEFKLLCQVVYTQLIKEVFQTKLIKELSPCHSCNPFMFNWRVTLPETNSLPLKIGLPNTIHFYGKGCTSALEVAPNTTTCRSSTWASSTLGKVTLGKLKLPGLQHVGSIPEKYIKRCHYACVLPSILWQWLKVWSHNLHFKIIT